MAVAQQLMVGMAEIKVSAEPAHFTCLGLGSCVGLVALDRQTGVCGMIHVMLPESFKDKPVDKLGKFADTGIPELIRQMEQLGADIKRLVAAYAGGAQVFQFGSGGSKLDVGSRNVEAVNALVKKHGLRVVAQDGGGSCGRTVIVDSSTGRVTVRTVPKGETELCNLRG